RVVLETKICYHNIGAPVAIDVARIHAHTSLGIAVAIERDFRLYAGVRKSSIMFVHQQQVRRGIAGHEQIRPAVVIKINSNDSEGPSHKLIETGRVADIGK